jgi:CRP-like cAMP-binding protein
METVRFKAGDTILTQGEEGNSAFLIVDGAVEISIGAGTGARVVDRLDAGDVFGEMSLIEPGPRSATVTAVVDTECMVTGYDEFIAAIREDPEQAVVFMQTLVRRLRHMNELMAGMEPGRRSLRDLFREWQASYDEADAARRDVEKMHPMF